MADTAIEWSDMVWNPLAGCTRVSAGCQACYAERLAHRLAAMGQKKYEGLTRKVGDDDIRWTGEVRFVEDALGLPLRWKTPRRVFVNSMSDLFHEKVADGWAMRILNVMAQTPHHTYQILTKRPERMRSFFTRWADLTGEDFGEFKNARGPEESRRAHPSPRGQLFAAMLDSMGKPPKGCAYPAFDWMEGMIRWPSTFRNIHLGVSVENQAAADERIPLLLQTPAAVRFLSVEPLLGPVDLSFYLPCAKCDGRGWYIVGNPFRTPMPDTEPCRDCVRRAGQAGVAVMPGQYARSVGRIHWVIVGGESGPRARPCDLAWIRSIVAQCRAAGVPVFVKQIGARPFTTEPERVDGRPIVGRPDIGPSGKAGLMIRLRDRKGGDMAEWPGDLRVREFPQ